MECFICESSGGDRVYNLSDEQFEVVKESAKLRVQYGDVKFTDLTSRCEQVRYSEYLDSVNIFESFENHI